MLEIPTGTVTFIFTDIEGSTSRWEHDPQRMQRDFARQETTLRETFTAFGGYVYKMIGDAFQVAFATAPLALKAAVEAQRRLQDAAWEGEPIRVRIALHTGVTEERGDDYVGPALNRVARLLATGYGGQVLLTQATYELVRDDLPPGASVIDLGEHRLKDLIRPERIYQIAAPGLPARFPALKTLDTYPHNLPVQLTSFVGREKEMAEVKRFFTADGAGETRLVTLTGPGGTGKTRLSLHVAAELLEAFPNGVWFVELAALTDPALVPHTIASVLGVRESPGGGMLSSLIDALRSRRLLLILDNCEHLVDACARAADALLRGCPRLCILASSRELLGVEGETPYRVPSLSTPGTHPSPTAENLPQYEAVRLFIERAATSSPGFKVTNGNAPAVAEICHRLDGMPLAIELVAARVSMMSVEQIAARLNDAFRLLTGGSRTAMPRHQTIRALIDWSYDMLPPAEQALLQRLSVFMGGWTLEAAEEICSDPPPSGLIDRLDILDLLAQLVKKSLVQVERGQGEPRYRLLETIRQYAREKLKSALFANEKLNSELSPNDGRTATGFEEIVRRHQAYYLALAEQAGDEIRGPQQAAWIERYEEELDNLRAALERSMQEEIEAGLRAGAGLLWFWHIRGHGYEGLEWLERLLAAEAAQRGTQLISVERAFARARALNVAGFMHYSYDNTGTGTALLEESLALLQGIHDSRNTDRETAEAHLNLGRLAANAMDFSAAKEQLNQALVLYRSAGDRFGSAETLTELGAVEALQGSRDRAAGLIEESLALRRAIGDEDGVGYNLASLGEFAMLRGEFARAVALLEESQDYFTRSHNLIFTTMTREFLSLILWMMGDTEGTLLRLEESLPLDLRPEEQYTATNVLLRRAEMALAQGDTDQAETLFTQCLTRARQMENRDFACTALFCLGRIACERGDYPLAEQQLEKAMREAQQYTSRGLIGQIISSRARVALLQGDYPRARALLQQAMPLFHMPFQHWAAVIGLELLICLAACQGQPERAARLYGAVQDLAGKIQAILAPGERALFERSLHTAKAALGEEAFAALAAEGRSLTLEQAAALDLEPGG